MNFHKQTIKPSKIFAQPSHIWQRPNFSSNKDTRKSKLEARQSQTELRVTKIRRDSPKKTYCVCVRIVGTKFDTRLNPAQHDRVGRLHDVPAHEHVVSGLVVEQLQNPRISAELNEID